MTKNRRICPRRVALFSPTEHLPHSNDQGEHPTVAAIQLVTTLTSDPAVTSAGWAAGRSGNTVAVVLSCSLSPRQQAAALLAALTDDEYLSLRDQALATDIDRFLVSGRPARVPEPRPGTAAGSAPCARALPA